MKLLACYSPFPQMGKNTFVEALSRIEPRTSVLSFADGFRPLIISFVSDFFPGGEAEVNEWLADERKDHRLIPGLGVTLRHALQSSGTWGRQHMHPDIWVMRAKAALRRSSISRVVIFDDLRFENEYAMLAKEGAVLIRIERKQAPKAKPHESNQRLEGMDFDYHVSNDGEVEELLAKALLIAQSEGIV